VLVNNRWCNSGHVTDKELLCTLDVELLASSPLLPAETVCDIVSKVAAKLQKRHADPFMVISEDLF